MGNLRKDRSSDSSPLSLAGWENREPGQVKCLRRGCENYYIPRRWNQQFCGDPQCKKEVLRWQAAKRQRRVRATEEGRQRHNERERLRRQAQRDRKSQPTQPVQPVEPSQPDAWSHCKPHPENFCDRPGCYDPVRAARSRAARYCGDECRQAVHRVRDRQRKYLERQRLAKEFIGSSKCDRSMHSGSRYQPGARLEVPRPSNLGMTSRVRNYGATDQCGLSSEAFSETHSGRTIDDQQRSTDTNSRAPPAAQ